MPIRVYIIAVCQCLVTLSGFTQQYPVVHYTPKDGLVNSRVRKVYQDSKGLLYFMTYNGLSIYDGTRFKNYSTLDGLTNDLINDIIEVTPDSLLVSTNSCGLNALVSGKIIKLNFEGPHCPIVNEILRTPEGRTYATTDDGLYELTEHGYEKFSTSNLSLSAPPHYLGNIADAGKYLVTANNELQTYHGLFLFDKGKKELIDAIPLTHVYQLKKGPENVLWVNHHGTLKHIDPKALSQGKLSLIAPLTLPRAGEEVIVNNFDFESHGNLVVLANGTAMREQTTGKFQIIKSPELAEVVIMHEYIDRENSLWICSDGNGVFKISQSNFSFDAPFSETYPGTIHVICNENKNKIGAITHKGKFILKSGSGERVFSLHPSINADGLHIQGREIYVVERNVLYYGVINDPSPDIYLRPILSLPGFATFDKHMITDPFGQTITCDKTHLYFFAQDKLIFSQPFFREDLVEGFFFTEDNLLWVIYRWSGIALYTLDPDAPEKYAVAEFNHTQPLEGASPRCAAIDSSGIFWIGTRSHGLLGFEEDGGIFKRRHKFDLQDGLTDYFITALYIDSDQTIYVGSQTGLDRLVKTNAGYRVENLTKRHNIFSFITSIWSDQDGIIYALSNAGRIFRLERESSQDLSTNPSLYIRDVLVNNEPISFDEIHRSFNHTERNLTIHVASPTYLDESQVIYRYRLNHRPGDQWSQPIRSGEINLFNLSPGEYTLFLKSEYPGTTYENQETTFAFSILPAWWQTTWFRLIAILATASFTFLLLQTYYKRKLERQIMIAEKQKAIEKERTRIATDMHDDLGSGLSRIRFLGENISWKNEHGQSIDQDVAKIKSYSHEMIAKMGEIVWALNEKNDSLEDLLSYIRVYTVEYMTQHGVECRVVMDDEPPTQFVSGEVRRNVFLTVKEALHNVVKHAKATEVMLTMHTKPELWIEIKDNGTGFAESNIRPFANGLSNMRNRIKEIGGQMVIENHAGTSIQLMIPISHN